MSANEKIINTNTENEVIAEKLAEAIAAILPSVIKREAEKIINQKT